MNGCGKFWESFDSIPMWSREGDELVCVDQKTGKELKRVPVPEINGIKMEIFETYAGVLLRDIQIDEDEYMEKGEEVNIQMMPNGQIYALVGHTCIKTGAEEGIDFEFI